MDLNAYELKFASFPSINLLFDNYIICQAPKNSPFLSILFENIKKTYPSNGHSSTNLQAEDREADGATQPKSKDMTIGGREVVV